MFFQQMRPLAAEALQVAREQTNTRHVLDYFTVDTGDTWNLSELVSGSQLNKHAQFVTLCVNRILELYRNSDTGAANVLLIGHGMSGNIAKMVPLMLKNPALIQVIITIQSKPFGLMLDREAEAFYDDIREEWSKRVKTKHVSLVSLDDEHPDSQADVQVRVVIFQNKKVDQTEQTKIVGQYHLKDWDHMLHKLHQNKLGH